MKIAIYIRLSKEDYNKQDESESIKSQRNLLKNYLKEKNWLLTKEYVDDGFSGTTFNRPAFNQLLEDINLGLIDTIITKDLSRLGRDYIQSGYFLEQYFPSKKVRYISVLDNIDTFNESSNNDIAPFKSLFNDMQSKDTSKKIRSILKDKKRAGLFLGNHAPFGYLKDPKNKHHLIVDKKIAPIIQKMFQLRYQKKSIYQICDYLNQNQIITPILNSNRKISQRIINPKEWTPSMVQNILKNPVYTGVLVQGVQAKLNYKSTKRILLPKSEWIIVSNTHEPIISKELFDSIQKKKRYSNYKKRVPFLLEDLIFCNECQTKMGIKKDTRNPNIIRYYLNCNLYTKNPKAKKCSSHFLNYNDLENIVLTHLKKHLSVVSIEQLEKKLQEKLDKENLIYDENNIQKKAENLELIKLIYQDRLQKKISEEIFFEMIEKIEKESQDRREEKNMNLKKFINHYLNNWNRDMITLFINKITVDKNKKINIYYNFK